MNEAGGRYTMLALWCVEFLPTEKELARGDSVFEMGGRTLPFSWHRVLDQKTNDQNSTLHKATMVNRPPASFINERPPCAATYLIGGLSGLVWWRRGGHGRLGG